MIVEDLVEDDLAARQVVLPCYLQFMWCLNSSSSISLQQLQSIRMVLRCFQTANRGIPRSKTWNSLNASTLIGLLILNPFIASADDQPQVLVFDYRPVAELADEEFLEFRGRATSGLFEAIPFDAKLGLFCLCLLQ